LEEIVRFPIIVITVDPILIDPEATTLELITQLPLIHCPPLKGSGSVQSKLLLGVGEGVGLIDEVLGGETVGLLEEGVLRGVVIGVVIGVSEDVVVVFGIIQDVWVLECDGGEPVLKKFPLPVGQRILSVVTADVLGSLIARAPL